VHFIQAVISNYTVKPLLINNCNFCSLASALVV